MDGGFCIDVAPKAASDIKLQTIVSAPDFELKASIRGKEDDEGYEAPLIKSTKDTAVGASDIGEKDMKDENSYAALQGRSCRPASSAGEGDNDSSGPLIQKKSTKSATGTNATDLEAAEDSQADDPLTSARFLRLKNILDSFDTVLLGVGCILHVIFVYWAFLDFTHPYLGNSIRSTSFWSFPTHFVSIPVTTLVLFTILGLSLFVMFFLCLLVYGTGAFLFALGKPAWLSFQAFVQGWMDRHPTIQSVVAITTTRVGEWANKTMAVFMSVTDKYPFIFAILMIVTVGPFMIVAFLIWSAVAVFIAQFLWTEYMLWVYDLISAEFAVLLIFGLVCFWLRGWLKWVFEEGWLSNESSEVSPYLDDMGITLFTGFIISFVVLTLWFIYYKEIVELM
ncbi:hypothetical protein V496_02270 [Pseudogymnoascus sp. VKM F-4515 (FW-2607)]|nr:hypothetical protein V496_02270 [Pseudogymnoascus sp. VKM F-4515 (FW-2607)]